MVLPNLIQLTRGQANALIGGGQFPWMETFDARLLASAAALIAANTAWFGRVRVHRPTPYSAIWFHVGAQAGNMDVGIYDSPDNGVTLNRIAASGSVAVPAAGLQSISLGATRVAEPFKDYWLALACDTLTATFGRTVLTSTSIGLEQAISVSKSASFPLPASVDTPAGDIRNLWLRAA